MRVGATQCSEPNAGDHWHLEVMMAGIGNAWHLPRNAEPPGQVSMRFPFVSIEAAAKVTLFTLERRVLPADQQSGVNPDDIRSEKQASDFLQSVHAKLLAQAQPPPPPRRATGRKARN